MKVLVIFALLAVTSAEPPPSNSYLPPPPASRTASQGQGYPSGRPEVVAARNLEGAGGVGGFARNGLQGQGQAKFSADAEGYERSSISFARNALEEVNAEPANYNFGYMVNDNFEGTDFGHHEHRQDERAEGQYHVVLPDGRKQTVNYKADETGFKPRVSYEESEGYDANASSRSSQGNGYNGGGNQGNGYSGAGNQGNGYSGAGNQGNGYSGVGKQANGYSGAGNQGNGYSANGRSGGY